MSALAACQLVGAMAMTTWLVHEFLDSAVRMIWAAVWQRRQGSRRRSQ